MAFARLSGKLILTQAKSWNLAPVGQDGEASLELAPHGPASQALPPRGVLAVLLGVGLRGRTGQGEPVSDTPLPFTALLPRSPTMHKTGNAR